MAICTKSHLEAGFTTVVMKSLGLLFKLALHALVTAHGGLPEVEAAEMWIPILLLWTKPVRQVWFIFITLGFKTDFLFFGAFALKFSRLLWLQRNLHFCSSLLCKFTLAHCCVLIKFSIHVPNVQLFKSKLGRCRFLSQIMVCRTLALRNDAKCVFCSRDFPLLFTHALLWIRPWLVSVRMWFFKLEKLNCCLETSLKPVE